MIKKKQGPVIEPPAETENATEGGSSFSAQTPVLALAGQHFSAGAEVEVRISSKGFYDSLYEAVVLSRFSVTRYIKYKVKYLTLFRDDDYKQQLVEDVYAKTVRPRAPRRLSAPDGGSEDDDPNFKMHDLVEAYHNDGWWHGVVSGLRDPATGLYTVSFPNTREVFQFKPSEIRPQLDFVNGQWVPVFGEAQKKKTFKEGDNVEVYQFRDDYGSAYFPARIEKAIHNYYFVKYESPNARPNGDLTEIVDPRFLRPAVDCIPGTNNFTAGSHVEVFHKGGWSPGLVLSGLSGSDYAVIVESKGEEMTEQFNVSNMRFRLNWNGKKWCKWSSHSKEKKRKSANSSEICASDVTLTKETPPDSVTFPSKKLKKNMAEEVQELQSPLQFKVTTRKDMEFDDRATIAKLFRVKSGSINDTSSYTPRIMRAVRKAPKSRKLLKDLKDCHSKIGTRKRSSTCNRNLNGWTMYKRQDNVDCNKSTTSEKDVNLSNESSCDVPQLNTNGKKEEAHVDTISCEQLQYSTSYTADLAGENAGISSHDRAVGHFAGSENQCMLNTQDFPTDGVAGISEGTLANSQALNSDAIIDHLTGNQDNISNPCPNRSVTNEAVPLHLLNSSFIVLPFEKTSPLWTTLESTLKVFSRIPQRPHFRKLESVCKEHREGMAIGMMVTYSNIAESILRLSIETDVANFQEKIACLKSLEENGFNVDPIRSRLKHLLEIKTNYTKSAAQRVKLETALANEQEKMSTLASANSYEARLADVRKSIEELKEKEKAIIEERAGVLSLTAELEHNISRLREEMSSLSRSHERCPEEFESVISKPLC